MDEGKLFAEIKFMIAQCNDADNIKAILIEGGAKHINYLSDDVTVVIADANCPRAEEAEELFDKPVVSSMWVHLSLKAKKLLPTQAFSPTKSVFSNIVASFSSNLSKNDIDILASTLTFYGARVSKDAAASTHFITANLDPSELTDRAISHQIKIVAPDWVLDSVKQRRCCDEHIYDPSLLLPRPPTPPPPPPPRPPTPAERKVEEHPQRQNQDQQKQLQKPQPQIVQQQPPRQQLHPPPQLPQQLRPQAQPTWPQQQQLHRAPPRHLQQQLRPQAQQIWHQQSNRQPQQIQQQMRPQAQQIWQQQSHRPPQQHLQHQVRPQAQHRHHLQSPQQQLRPQTQQLQQHQLQPPPQQLQRQLRPQAQQLQQQQLHQSLQQLIPRLPQHQIEKSKLNYFGHDPKKTIPKDFPLTGCRFKIIEYEEINSRLRSNWIQAIEAAGGIFDENIENVSHLICESRLSDVFSEAMKLGVRCVTIYWVNDVLAQDRLTFPWKALHLPLPFRRDSKPLKDQIISTTNLKCRERREVKEMILKTGAMYTDYFSPTNTLIICGNVGGEKYERAVEWKIPIANCQILSDFLITNGKDLNAMLTQSKYQLFHHTDPLKLISYSDVKELMDAWTKPIPINDIKNPEKLYLANGANKSPPAPLGSNDDSGVATGGSNDSEPTTEFQDNSRKNRPLRKSNGPVRLLFTHLNPSLIEKLRSYASELGLGFAASPINCTHLIVDRISRTPKFVCAFSHANYILSYKWVVESHEANNLLDEKPFILQDKNGEEKYSFNLIYSLLKRKKRSGLLFSNFIFFVTPSVLSDVSNLKEMIESAGGIMVTRKPPSEKQINRMKADGKRFVVVSCDVDSHLCSTFGPSVDIVNAEFVISGILRQDIDIDLHRIKTQEVTLHASSKRLRLDDSAF